MAPLQVHHLDLYVLQLIADREIGRESYLILRVVSGPQHCALYVPSAEWCFAFFSGIAMHLFQENDVKSWKRKARELKHILHLGHNDTNVCFPLMVGYLSHPNG